MPEEHEDDDRTIVDALSALGWVEEKEQDEIQPEMGSQEQIKLFKAENERLTKEITKLSEANRSFKKEKEAMMQVLENHKIKIENLETKLVNASSSEAEVLRVNSLLNDLNNTMKEKQRYIQQLFSSNTEQNNMIQEQNSIIEQQNALIKVKNKEIESIQLQIENLNNQINGQKSQIDDLQKATTETEDMTNEINNLKAQLDDFKKEQAETDDILGKLQEKESKIRELTEQLQYLESDTVQKSKFDKVNLLIEKKDEIITEKEKAIFEIQNELTSANQRINELQQQLETFSLLKKDLTKKDERIKTLVMEVEELKQKDISNINLQKRLEENLNGKVSEINSLKSTLRKVEDQLSESEQIEDKILNDLQKSKDDNLKLESQITKKDEELVELKKRIKMMRRDMTKS